MARRRHGCAVLVALTASLVGAPAATACTPQGYLSVEEFASLSPDQQAEACACAPSPTTIAQPPAAGSSPEPAPAAVAPTPAPQQAAPTPPTMRPPTADTKASPTPRAEAGQRTAPPERQVEKRTAPSERENPAPVAQRQPAPGSGEPSRVEPGRVVTPTAPSTPGNQTSAQPPVPVAAAPPRPGPPTAPAVARESPTPRPARRAAERRPTTPSANRRARDAARLAREPVSRSDAARTQSRPTTPSAAPATTRPPATGEPRGDRPASDQRLLGLLVVLLLAAVAGALTRRQTGPSEDPVEAELQQILTEETLREAPAERV